MMASLDFVSVLLIAIGLSADCFAVAVSSGAFLRTVSYPQVLRLSLAFGLSQALMPVLGWLAGQAVVGLIAAYDHWIAFILLAIVGSRMIWGSLRSRDSHDEKTDITKGLLLLTLSVATSIDALVIGLSFAFLEINITLASSTIGIVAFAVTATGLLVGTKAGKLIGRRAGAIGGVVLISIGLRVLLSHIL